MSCYRRILVALDGSPDSEAALAHAVALARDQNARLTLLTVVPHSPTPIGPGVSAPPELTDVHAAILKDALASLPKDVGITTRLEHGDAAATILRLATEEDHDLIVMGSHGHGRVRRALLGSVSEKVLHTATVPVLLMRGGKKSSGEPPPDAPPEYCP